MTTTYEGKEKCFAMSRGQWYPSTIMEKRGLDRYKIHYEGWNKKWDETVPSSRLKKDTPEVKEEVRRLNAPASGKSSPPSECEKDEQTTERESNAIAMDEPSVSLVGGKSNRGEEEGEEKLAGIESTGAEKLAAGKEENSKAEDGSKANGVEGDKKINEEKSDKNGIVNKSGSVNKPFVSVDSKSEKKIGEKPVDKQMTATGETKAEEEERKKTAIRRAMAALSSKEAAPQAPPPAASIVTVAATTTTITNASKPTQSTIKKPDVSPMPSFGSSPAHPSPSDVSSMGQTPIVHTGGPSWDDRIANIASVLYREGAFELDATLQKDSIDARTDFSRHLEGKGGGGGASTDILRVPFSGASTKSLAWWGLREVPVKILEKIREIEAARAYKNKKPSGGLERKRRDRSLDRFEDGRRHSREKGAADSKDHAAYSRDSREKALDVKDRGTRDSKDSGGGFGRRRDDRVDDRRRDDRVDDRRRDDRVDDRRRDDRVDDRRRDFRLDDRRRDDRVDDRKRSHLDDDRRGRKRSRDDFDTRRR